MSGDGHASDVPPMVDDVVLGLYRIFQSVDHFSRKSLRELGMSGPLVWALRTIRDAECTTLDDLARRIHLPLGTVSGLVDRLEERGAARRRAFEGDGALELRLTTFGRRLLSGSPEPPHSRMARGIEQLSPEDRKCLRRAVAMLNRILHVRESEGATDPAS